MANRKTVYTDKQDRQNRPQHDMAKVQYDSEEARKRFAEGVRSGYEGATLVPKKEAEDE